MRKIIRLFHTVRYLRPRQIGYQLRYRLRSKRDWARTQVQGMPEKAWRVDALPEAVAATAKPFAASYLPPASFRFLNLSPVDFGTTDTIDWNYAQNGKLWTYNLNYFEFIRSATMPPEMVQALIDAWIDGEGNHKDGWEPYPISLRLVNWVQHYRSNGLTVPKHVSESLRRQQIALWQQLEYHLDGNHLLENAFALVVAEVYHPYRAQAAHRLLEAQLAEQYLSDGAHYERSTMYQLTLLWRGLDVYSSLPQEAVVRQSLGNSLRRQLGYVAVMVDANGYYPHFNDSTDGIAPSPAAVEGYSAQLGLSADKLPLGESGYRRWDWDGGTLWMDAGQIGPDHIPGHAHADSLSFCWNVNGHPVVVDTAISTYEKNDRRQQERGTAAHNTVQLDGRNSSQVWGGFRVAKRARTRILEDSGKVLRVTHDGYDTPHERTWSYLDNGFEITDAVTGPAVARLHFNHEVQPVRSGREVLVEGVRIVFSTGTLRSASYQQAVGFNDLRTATVVIVEFTDRLVSQFFYA